MNEAPPLATAMAIVVKIATASLAVWLLAWWWRPVVDAFWIDLRFARGSEAVEILWLSIAVAALALWLLSEFLWRLVPSERQSEGSEIVRVVPRYLAAFYLVSLPAALYIDNLMKKILSLPRVWLCGWPIGKLIANTGQILLISLIAVACAKLACRNSPFMKLRPIRRQILPVATFLFTGMAVFCYEFCEGILACLGLVTPDDVGENAFDTFLPYLAPWPLLLIIGVEDLYRSYRHDRPVNGGNRC